MTYFSIHNLEILEVVVLKEIISLEFKVFKNLSKALELTTSSLSRVQQNESKFLLNENIGKLYFDNNQKEKSKNWLITAIEFDCVSQSTYIDTLLLGASVISDENSRWAVKYCEKVNTIASNDKDYLELNYIQLIGELALAYWVDKDYIKSFKTFENFVNRLFKTKEENFGQNWIRLFLWCAHSLGYISAEVARDRPPEFISTGEEYFKPYQGVFTLNNKDLSDLYESKNEPIILAHLAIFSDGINNISKAYEWSLRAFDLARKNGDQKIFLLISSVCSQYSIINFKFEEAFESFLLFSAITSHLEGTPNEKMESMEKVKISDILSSKPNEKWNRAEDVSVEFVIIPTFIMILTSFLENSEQKIEKAEKFKKMLNDYYYNSSDKLLWEMILELTSRVFSGSISERELINRSDTFGEQERKSLQIICILGIIHLSKKSETILTQILNIIPYLTKTYRVSSSLIKFSLIPFVKVQCLNILKDNYVGTKQEFDELTKKIMNVDITAKNAIQVILLPLINEFEIGIIENRRPWLYEFKEFE
jgi:tetratricopeptide (TPR) repeat protein